MFKKVWFWIVFSLVSVVCALFAFRLFPQAFPIVSIDLTMNRQQALERAEALTQHSSPQYREAASFTVDASVQNFVELEAGGKKAFRSMIEEKLYQPYTWHVRHFKEGETRETHFRFTPSGDCYGFYVKLPEDQPGAALQADSALSIAEWTAKTEWNIDFSPYELVEKTEDVRIGGRVDHTFVYERQDADLGEGKYRLRLVVGGDALTGLRHFVKIPEGFSRRYAEMRSDNTTIATAATLAMVVLYVVGGIIVGLFFLLRKRWVLWKKPLLWGSAIAFLQVLVSVNNWPLLWMSYDTALSASGFFLQNLMQWIGLFFAETLLLTATFIAAESLTRKAFPQHLRFWRLWSSDTAPSTPVLGRTAGAYLWTNIKMLYVIVFYFIAAKSFNWWIPSSTLFEPDILATYFPWLSSIAISLHAGFWEECLFRAIPIAGAVLLGQRFGYKRIWIVAAFILQAVIFGAAHANYAQQPAYARIVEMFIPFLIFAFIYYYFGLLPVIISHFVYDVIFFSIPLFVSSAEHIWMDKLIVIVLALVPLWVVLYQRLRKKKWLTLTEASYNYSWQPPEAKSDKKMPEEESLSFGHRRIQLVYLAGLVGLILWLIFTPFKSLVPPLKTDRDQALEVARQEMQKRQIELPEQWKEMSYVLQPKGQDDRFVWQEGDEEIYLDLMDDYLVPPLWKVRYATFEGDVAERAEEYVFSIGNNGKLYRFVHQLPEAREGASLSEEKARTIAQQYITDKYNIEVTTLKQVTAEPSKLPNRMDWFFTYADTTGYPLEQGEARIDVDISGDQVTDSYRYVYVPEEWERQERNEMNVLNIIEWSSVGFLVIVLIIGFIASIVGWSRKVFSVKTFLIFTAVLFAARLLVTLNSWPSIKAMFVTAQPYSTQLFMTIVGGAIGILFIAGGLGMIIGYTQSRQTGQGDKKSLPGVGIATGFFFAGVFAVFSRIKPTLEPYWAEFAYLAKTIPLLDLVLSPFFMFFQFSVFFMLVFIFVYQASRQWTRYRAVFIVILIFIGFIFSGFTGVNSLISFLIIGALTGLILFLLYRHVFHYQLALIPVFIATIMSLGQIRQMVINPQTTVVAGTLLAVALLFVLSIYWYRHLNKA
jgi:membrane protease YdiL (CAAX protease family)